MIRRPPRSTLSSSSAASDVYKRQVEHLGITAGMEADILIDPDVPMIAYDFSRNFKKEKPSKGKGKRKRKIRIKKVPGLYERVRKILEGEI